MLGVWSQCCTLHPGIVVTGPLPGSTAIEITIVRGGAVAFQCATMLNQMKRTLPELAQWFWSDNHFPAGCYLLTGTGLVPPDGFALASEDEIRITITGLGPLINTIT